MKRTREEIIDMYFKLKALESKAACREVNCDILSVLSEAIDKVDEAYQMINEIIENTEG